MAESLGYAEKKSNESFLRSSDVSFEERNKHRTSYLRLNSLKVNLLTEPCLDDFHVGDCKGEGRFGKVHLAVHKKTGFVCALKKIKKELVKHMMDQFIQELKIQLFLNHPKLVKMYGYFSDSEYFYLLVEYMEEGSLYSLMKKNKKFSEEETAEKIK